LPGELIFLSLHLLGLVRGSSDNARVMRDLLDSLVKRGIDTSRQRLFVVKAALSRFESWRA